MENYVFDGLSCCCVLAYCKLLPRVQAAGFDLCDTSTQIQSAASTAGGHQAVHFYRSRKRRVAEHVYLCFSSTSWPFLAGCLQRSSASTILSVCIAMSSRETLNNKVSTASFLAISVTCGLHLRYAVSHHFPVIAMKHPDVGTLPGEALEIVFG